jgi:cytochrome c oxidase cbb3-type subunit 1
MVLTVGTLMALSFAVSLLALAALIWAIVTGQLRFTEADARTIFEPGEEGRPDDPVAYGTGLDARDAAAEADETRWARRLLVFIFATATLWLLVGSGFGVVASLKMHLPDWLTESAPLTFGRMRAMHLNSVVYGFLSLGGIGTGLWLVPTMLKTRLRLPSVALAGAVLWNLGVAGGVAAIAVGWTDGLEWLEIPWQFDIVLAVAGAGFAASFIASVRGRRVEHIYVSAWYLMAALFWFPTLFWIANLPGVHLGAQQATVNWWFAHNVLGLWLTPLGLAAAYYFLPKIIGKPVYSYRLSLLGFWALALFYSQIGIHHLVGGPVPTWVVTLSVVQSVMMVVPVVAVAINHHVLVAQNFWAFRESLPLRFVSFGALMYTLASLQGALMALRSFNTVTHFTHYTVGHAHLGAYAFVGLVLFGAMYYMLPRLLGRRWPYPALIGLHFWLVAIGFGIYFVALTAGGVLQGFAMVDPARDFLVSMELTVPWLQGRSIGGAMMTLGHLVFGLHLAALLAGFGRGVSADQRTQALATSEARS